jgi:hypothetical protein
LETSLSETISKSNAMNSRLFYQNPRQVGINSENSDDTRLVLEDTPLIMRQKKQEVACQGKGLKDMPKEVWILMLRYLSLQDIHALRRANGVIRKRIKYALQSGSHDKLLSDLHNMLTDHHKAYIKSGKVMRKKCVFYTLEAGLALTTCILAASLPIDCFQKNYVSAYQNISQTMTNSSTVTLTWDKNNPSYNCAPTNVTWHLPGSCDVECFRTYITDGPAGYWFVAFITSNATYASIRSSISIPYEKYPVPKIIAEIGATALAGLTVSLPVLGNLGWSSSSAIHTACCMAKQCDLYKHIESCVDWQRTYNISTVCFGDIGFVTPLIPLLAEVPPFALTAAAVGGMIALGFWAYRKIQKIENVEIDPSIELYEASYQVLDQNNAI